MPSPHLGPAGLRPIRRSRGGRIRTGDLRVPNAALYQAEPRPDGPDDRGTLGSVSILGAIIAGSLAGLAAGIVIGFIRRRRPPREPEEG